MPEITVRVKSPIKSSVHTLTIDNEDVFGSIRQYLLALSPLLQPATAFYLASQNTPLAGETSVTDVFGDSVTEVDLDMVLSSQTFQDVKVQLDHIKEALGLAGPDSTYLNAAPVRISNIRPGSKKTKKIGEDDLMTIVDSAAADHDIDVLAAYPNDLLPKPAAKELQFSKWQSVARDPRLRMQGVLAFLKFRANDSKSWHFVATSKGYTSVPQLTDDVFALPAKTAVYVPTLIQLIEQVSPNTISLARKIADRIKADPLGCVEVPQVVSVAPWLVDNVPSVGSGYGGANPTLEDDVSRDRNEDFQATREIQVNTIAERINRERRLYQATIEFSAAAMETASRIVEGAVKPLNPDEEPESTHVYLSNGIFFTYGTDFTESYTDLGGDVAARQAAKKDLRGVEQLMALDEPDLCPVLTTVVDYMGRRLIAQAPVPGIFRETEEPMIVYGRSENKEEVYHDEKVGELMSKLSQRLHLKSHPVTRDGIELHTSADVHGTRGTDGRIYAIDLARLQVPDLLTTHEGLNLLRNEAVAHYYLAKRDEQTQPLNPDVWMPKDEIPESYAAEFENDIAAAKDVARYVREEIAPSLINKIASGVGIDPIDGLHLTTLMHRAGINMRLLGLISRLGAEAGLQNLTDVALEEAIARSLKWTLNDKLKDASIVEATAIVEQFVQSFRNQDAKIVAAVKSRVESHFGFTQLNSDWASKHLPRLSLLRLLSYKMGLQWNTELKLLAINPVVQFASPRSLLADEALEAGRRSLEAAALAKQQSESGSDSAEEEDSEKKKTDETAESDIHGADSDKTSPEAPMSSQDIETAFSEGFTLVTEAVSIYSQVYGPAHAETARVLNHAALIFLEYSPDITKAIEFGRRAITVAERVEGLDCHDVLVMYGNLAYFEREAGHIATSLELLERVFAIVDKIAWPGYSDLSITLSSVATMLQQSGKPKLQKASIAWFDKAIKVAEKTPTGVKGTLWFDYAQSQLFNQDLKGAVRSMELSHDVFKSTVGPEDANTKETKKYLEQLLQVTVHSAHSKSNTLAQAANRKQMEQRSTATVAAASKSRKSKGNKSNVPRLGERHLNDVLDYIMGDTTSKPKKKSSSSKKA